MAPYEKAEFIPILFSLIPFLLCAQSAQNPAIKNMNTRLTELEGDG